MERTKKVLIEGIVLFAIFFTGCGDGENKPSGDADLDTSDENEGEDLIGEEIQEILPDQPMEESEIEFDGIEIFDADSVEEELPPPPPPLAITTNASFDYSSGSYSIVNIETMEVSRNVMTIHSDALPKCLGGRFFVLERFGADTVTLVDNKSPFNILSQYSVEAGSNPVDMDLLSEETGIVTRNNLTRPAIISLVDGSLNTEAIDLSNFADSDGIPEASAVKVIEGKIFIALQLLDRGTPLWDPTGPGKVVVLNSENFDLIDVNPATPQEDLIVLSGANPLVPFYESPVDTSRILIAEVGFYGQTDGGIEGIDVNTYEKTGFIITEEVLGGDISAWVVVDEHTGYAAISKLNYAGDKIVRFDPSSGRVTRDSIIESGPFTLTGMALTRDGKLLVVSRDLNNPGIYIIDANTGNVITSSPVDTGTPPFAICAL